MFCVSQVHPIEDQVARFLARKIPGRGRVGSVWTTAFYRNALERRFLPWALSNGITDASELTVPQWEAYIDHLRGLPKVRSIRSTLTYLNALRILLVALGFGREKLKAYELPKAPRTMLEILTREEIDALENAATNERDKLIVRVLADTGIRLSELTGLKPADFREFTSPIRYYTLKVWGKGSKERDVIVRQPLAGRLKAYVAQGGPRAYIFPALQHDRGTGALAMLDGARLSNNTIDRLFRQLKRDTGITKPCTPHKLRHAYATYALQNGMAIEKLQEDLGHSGLDMIIRVYKHLSTADRAREHERVFGGGVIAEEPKRRKRIA